LSRLDDTDSVFRYEPFGIFLVFTISIPKENSVSIFGILKLAGAPFPKRRGGASAPFCTLRPPLLLSEKIRQFTCYWCTVFINHVTTSSCVIGVCDKSHDKCDKKRMCGSQNKYKKERERAQHGNHGRRRPWPLASPMPRPHVFRLDKFIRHILGDAVCA